MCWSGFILLLLSALRLIDSGGLSDWRAASEGSSLNAEEERPQPSPAASDGGNTEAFSAEQEKRPTLTYSRFSFQAAFRRQGISPPVLEISLGVDAEAVHTKRDVSY